MWQGVGACHRGRDKWYGVRPMAWMETCSRVRACGMMLGACGRVWEPCGRVWAHVAGGAGMSQQIGAYGRGSGGDMWQALGTCGRVWGHVVGVVAYGRVWAHVAGHGGM